MEVLNLPVSTPELSQTQPQGVTFRVVDKHLYADFSADVPNWMVFNIYSIDGRLINNYEFRNTNFEKHNSTLPASGIDLFMQGTGVYAVQLITDNKATTGSTLIRLQ